MERKDTNRANQLSIEKKYIKGVKLIDIDTTIAEYMSETIIPDVEEHEKKIKVPLIYGNAERWKGARKDGYLRDERGKIQIPLVMFKRNSIERDESLQNFKDAGILPAFQQYSSKNRYERGMVNSYIDRYPFIYYKSGKETPDIEQPPTFEYGTFEIGGSHKPYFYSSKGPSARGSDLEKFKDFFDKMPEIKKDVQFKCPKCSYEESIVIKGMQNFFV